MKRDPVTIDGASGRVLREGKALTAQASVHPPPHFVIPRRAPPQQPSLGAVLDTIAREAIEDMARDAASELRRAVRRGLGGR